MSGSATDPDRARLLKGVPVEERRVEVAGTATSVLVAGHGSPVILLHGGIECGGAYWGPVISRLAERYRVIVPDVPGLGESAPIGRTDPGTFADWFAALLRMTCDEAPALVAHSLLGTFAARFAAQHGHLLTRLFIYGAPGVGRYRMPLGLLLAAILFDLRPSEHNSKRFECWAFLDLDRTLGRDAEWFRAFRAYARSRAMLPHVKRTMRQLIRTGTKQVPDTDLRRIEVPTALLWGRHDRMAPLHLAEGARARLGWPLYVIDHAGHVPHIEQPEAFLAALHGALASSRS
jgi:pimeloyl-ACP methyl ester carboxylesterase